jgi:septal ring factor EnvC (AmiA/AmiB activator)
MKSTLTGLILAAIPLVSFAQTEETNRLKDIVKQQEQAKAQNAELEEKKRAVQNEIRDLNSQMIRLAADSSNLERTGRDLDLKLTRLEAKNAALKQAIYGDRKTLAKLLGALQRIENNPPPALAIAPDNAADAVIAAKLTASISQRLTSRTESLSQQLEDLAANRSKITAEQQEIQKNEADLAARRQSIRTLVGQKTELEQSVSNSQAEAQKRAAALAAQADDLRELITKLERALIK